MSTSDAVVYNGGGNSYNATLMDHLQNAAMIVLFILTWLANKFNWGRRFNRDDSHRFTELTPNLPEVVTAGGGVKNYKQITTGEGGVEDRQCVKYGQDQNLRRALQREKKRGDVESCLISDSES